MSTAMNWICSVDIKPFPAVWGYRLMLESTFTGHTLWPLIVITSEKQSRKKMQKVVK